MTCSRTAIAGFALGAIAMLCLLAAGLGTRFGWWDFRTGFDLLRYGAWTGLAAAAVALLACFRASAAGQRGLVLAAAGLVLGVLAFALPYGARDNARKHPRIHDITTDTGNPPPFVAILPLRAKARNPARYGGPAIAAQQKKAYPDIAPMLSGRPADALFAAALATARGLGWEIVATDPAAGRIEASDRTFWFGFTDDIVIRIASDAGRTRLDIRSKSRVGRNDAGVNAARIRRFTAALRNRLAE